MNTPTPRTDAAWASSFEPCEYRAAHTARTMRDECERLEIELTALTAERDKLRAQNDQFSDNLSAVGAVYNAEKARAERAEAEAERYRLVTLRQDAELTTERARLDYLSTRGFEHRHHGTGDHLGYEWTISSYSESEDVTLRDVIDAEMQEEAK